MKFALVFVLLAGSLCCLVPTAVAAGGGFLSARVGETKWSVDRSDNSSTSYAVQGGYRWLMGGGDSLGFMAGYTDFGSLEGHGTPYGLFGIPPLDAKAIDIGLSYEHTFAERWFFHARAGVTRITSEEKIYRETGNGFYAGAGLGYYFTSRVGVSVNYDIHHASVSRGGYFNSSDNRSLNSFSVGLELRF